MIVPLLVALCATNRATGQNLLNGGQTFPLQSQPKTADPRLHPNSYVVQGPADVGTATRPAGWPASQAAAGQHPGQRVLPGPPSGAAGVPSARGTWADGDRAMQFDLLDLDGARIIARVGTEVIQDTEVSTYVDEFMEANAGRIPPKQVTPLRDKLTRDRLSHLIEIKLALVDAQRKVPPEAYPKIVESIGTEFETKEVKKKLKQLNLATRGDLDAKLRERGTSLDREKQAYIDQQLAFTWLFQQTKTKHEATHEDMLAYYLENLDDYEFPAKARWEELRLRVANYPNRSAARQALGELGNDVLRGANFADVARVRSQGPTAAAGGQYDWTTQGSLSSDLLDRAIFTLQVGRMSQILDDGHSPTISIVRVIERTEAGRTPFTEVQAEIKGKLATAHAEKDKQKLHDYLVKLRAETPVWTVYDDQPPVGPVATGEKPAASATPSTSLRPATPASGTGAPSNPYLR